ncbi:hypothetical protein Q3G72_032432 [Acer saccharum]|nr:hypothetical protein Q3G72_032432 [Acer saccharum]
MMDPAHFEAAQKGNINAFPFCDMINKSDMSDVFSKVSPLGNSLLHIAASFGHVEMTLLIADYFPSLITNKNFEGDTAVHVAIKAGILDTTQVLVSRSRADDTLLKIKNNEGNTPLHEALTLVLQASMNRLTAKEIVELEALVCYLVTIDPEVCYLQNNAGKSPLYLAVESGNKQILQYLLGVLSSCQHSVNELEGKSPVHVAIEQKNLDVLKVIKAQKQELLLLRDEDQNTPLHFAASIGYVEGVRYFLEINSNAGALERNKEGLYPLHLVCENGHVKIINELFKKWPDPTELLNEKGQNILHIAAKSGKVKVVRRILKEIKTSNFVNKMDKDGNIPLHLATLHCHSLVVGTLLWDKRSNSNLTNNQGLTAYDIAEKQSEILDSVISGKQNASRKDQPIEMQIISDETSRVDSHGEEQSTKVDSKKPKKPNPFEAMITLSILFVVHNYRVSHAHGSLIKRYYKAVKNLRIKSKPPGKEEFKHRIDNFLVVATLIVGSAFAASVQMANSFSPNSTEDIAKWTRTFAVCVTIAMNDGIIAAFMLCWAQLVDSNLASLIAWLAFVMVGFALYAMSGAFLAATYILMRSDTKFIMAFQIVQAIFLFVQLVMDYLFRF